MAAAGPSWPALPNPSPIPSLQPTSEPSITLLNPNASPFFAPASSLTRPNGEPSNLWSKKLFSLDHIPNPQRLDYFSPSKKGDRLVAMCNRQEVETAALPWEEAIQGFFADRRPFFPGIISMIEKIWKLSGLLEAFARPDDSMIFKFGCPEDRTRVLRSGPWFVAGRYLHLKPWSLTPTTRADFFASIPTWIRLPNLPLHFWTPGSIGRISSVVGKPLFMDEISANSSKLRFVRICVEVFASKPLPSSVFIEVEGGLVPEFEQKIEYESKLDVCSSCKAFGHAIELCTQFGELRSTLRTSWKDTNKKGSSIKGVLLKGDPVTSNHPLPSRPPVVVAPTINPGSEGCKSIITGTQEKSEWTTVRRKKKKKKKATEVPAKNFISDVQVGRDGTNPETARKAMDDSNVPGGSSNSSLGQGDAKRKLQNDNTAANPGFAGSMPFDCDFTLPPNGSNLTLTNSDFATEHHQAAPCNSGSFSTPSNPNNHVIFNPILVPLNTSQNLPTSDYPTPQPSLPSSNLITHQPNPNQTKINPPQTTSYASTSLDQTHVLAQLLPNLNASSTLSGLVPKSEIVTSALPEDEDCGGVVHADLSETSFKPGVLPFCNSDFMEDFNKNEISTPIWADNLGDEDVDLAFPPGFTPTKEDLLNLRELMKEGVELVPPKHRNDFLKLVDHAEDGEIVEFFREKFKEPRRR